MHPFAISRRLSVVENVAAQALVFADDAKDFAGFVLQKPIPTAVDPMNPGALERLAATEADSLVQLSGSPLVRDRLERSSRVFVSIGRLMRPLRTASTSQLLSFGTPTTSFALRNRLLSAFSGRDPSMLGMVPTGPAGATEDDEHVVNLFFRFGDDSSSAPSSLRPASCARTWRRSMTTRTAPIWQTCEASSSTPARTA
jgi:hypothetical protein